MKIKPKKVCQGADGRREGTDDAQTAKIDYTDLKNRRERERKGGRERKRKIESERE